MVRIYRIIFVLSALVLGAIVFWFTQRQSAEKPSSAIGAGLIRSLSQVQGGAEVQATFQSLALQKADALPAVKERLLHGEMWEKFKLTKFLRYCPWPETRDDLVALASDNKQHWLPRQGALYALGALGDRTAGSSVAAILLESDCPAGVRLAAISALARIPYPEAADAIRLFTQDADIHLRLCAAWALAKFGEPVDQEFLLAALGNENYVVRQEACGALGAAGMTEPLKGVAQHDPHQAVRLAASQALLQNAWRGQSVDGKMTVLRDALPGADRFMATWILRTMLGQGGAEGRAFLETLAADEGYLGERSRYYLVMAGSR
jgi:hypothetical protein